MPWLPRRHGPTRCSRKPLQSVHVFSLAVGRFWQAGLPGMLNLEDGAFGTAGIQSGKVLWRRWTLELEVFCTGWTVFFESGDLAFFALTR